jgi:hypothetical protein
MTSLGTRHASFTAHQRLHALGRIEHHPGLDSDVRAALRALWTSLWHEQALGRMLWADNFQRSEVGGEHRADAFAQVGLGRLINAWRAVGGLAPIDPSALDHPTETIHMASSILVPLKTVLGTTGIASTCAWFPPLDWWREGNLVVVLRRSG